MIRFTVHVAAVSLFAFDVSLICSLAPLAFAASESVHVAANAQECTGPGTCSSEGATDEANSSNVSTDPSSVNQHNPDDQSDEAGSEPPEPRLIFEDEMALHTGKGGASPDNPIWISILGKVYDVTAGEEYYGAEMNGNYKFYAGKDASPCFSSGDNTPEGAAVDWTKWEDSQLVPMLEWARFYQDHEKYQYLGVLAGSKWFTEEGHQTELRTEFVNRAVPYEIKMVQERKLKQEEKRAKRIEKKRAKEEEAAKAARS